MKPRFIEIEECPVGPLGRFDCVPSNATGEMIRYFSPDQLSELLKCARLRRNGPELDPLTSMGLALVMVRPASESGAGSVDARQAQRFGALLQGKLQPRNLSELIQLGTAISAANSGLRKEIVFAGGQVASRAKHVFAPYQDVPSLMDELALQTASEQHDCHPTALVAITAFYCVFVHPFVDGNGRWSRLVSASMGIRSGSAAPAMVNAVMQSIGRVCLADLTWPTACRNGLRGYLEQSLEFESALIAHLESAGVLTVLADIGREISRGCRSTSGRIDLLCSLFVDQELLVDDLTTRMGSSRKVAIGLVERITRNSGRLLTTTDTSVTSLNLGLAVRECVTSAAIQTSLLGKTGEPNWL